MILSDRPTLDEIYSNPCNDRRTVKKDITDGVAGTLLKIYPSLGYSTEDGWEATSSGDRMSQAIKDKNKLRFNYWIE